MSGKRQDGPGKGGGSDGRAERLAGALRANLARRKEQARVRVVSAEPSADETIADIARDARPDLPARD